MYYNRCRYSYVLVRGIYLQNLCGQWLYHADTARVTAVNSWELVRVLVYYRMTAVLHANPVGDREKSTVLQDP